MYFLETISGLSGENLTSAVLKYLLINSGEFRALFVHRLVGVFPPSAIPVFREGIVCKTEDALDGGRIDLLVRADNCLIAIENKLWAELQPGQPGKYAAHVKRRAEEYSGKDVPYRILLVAPEQRKKELEKAIDGQDLQGTCFLLTWQSVVQDLERVEKVESAKVAAVASFLREYVTSNIDAYTSLGIKADCLVGQRVPIKNHYQIDLLYRLRTLFTGAGKIASGKQHIGFNFTPHDDDDGRPLWLGFVYNDGSFLEVHTSSGCRSFTLSPGVSETGNSYWGGARLRIAVPEGLHSLEDWNKLLHPLMDALRATTPRSASAS